jgi:large subunit ribosomal protein L25
MPDTYAAEPRLLLGKAVSRLRRQGVLPANIYGRGLESTAVQIEARDVRTLLHDHGINTLVNLQVSGEAQPRSVVVRKVQRHPVSHQLEHVDFYQVDLARAIQGPVPVVLTGEAPAVHTYKALLLQGADTVVVEALPAQMPTHVEISVDGLTELDSTATVADLDLPAGVTAITAPDVVLAQISRPRGAAADEEEALPEGEQEEGAEGEAAAETSGDGEPSSE